VRRARTRVRRDLVLGDVIGGRELKEAVDVYMR
jgi:hypothetical protein